jgi:methyl-accepting chemotaxis protein
MRISKLAKFAALIVLVGFATVIGAGFFAIKQIAVGGPVYERIVLGKDLVADILPPPAYIIEAFLEVSQANGDPSHFSEHKAKLGKLQSDYESRQKFWAQQDIDPVVSELLTKKADAPAQRFWSIANERFLPALEKNDAETASKGYEELKAAYDEHRAQIDKAVVEANRMTAETEAYAASTKTFSLWSIAVIALLVVSVILATVAGALLGVVRPLDQMAKGLSALAHGDTDVTFVGRGRNDEIGDMASSADIFRENTLERIRLEEVQRSVREREKHREEQVEKLVQEFKDNMATLVAALEQQVGSMKSVAGALTKTADTTFTQAGLANHASAGAADNSRAVASATEQLQASIKEISSQAHQTNAAVTEASESTAQSSAGISGLAEATERIGSVVELIRSIAQQTNLLALNATIESARAGEAGKGFAVVAAEVKNLATQTSRATDEIAQQITEVQTRTRDAVGAIRTISSKVAQINSLTGAIAAAVEQQEAATREIAENVTMAADRSTAAANGVESLSEAADETKQEAQSVVATSDLLAKVSLDMQASLNKFVAALSSDLQERRREPRIADTPWPMQVFIGGHSVETEVLDCSRSGMRVRALADVSPGQSIELDWGEGRCAASVAWTTSAGAGLKFSSLRAEVPSPKGGNRRRAA